MQHHILLSRLVGLAVTIRSALFQVPLRLAAHERIRISAHFFEQGQRFLGGHSAQPCTTSSRIDGLPSSCRPGKNAFRRWPPHSASQPPRPPPLTDCRLPTSRQRPGPTRLVAEDHGQLLQYGGFVGQSNPFSGATQHYSMPKSGKEFPWQCDY